MLTLLGRSVLSSSLRLSPIYRTPLIYPVGSGHRTPTDGYRNPISARAYNTSDGGDDYEDFGPIPPTILYTDGIRGSPEQGSHMGIGIFIDDDHDLNLCMPVMGKKDQTNAKNPELQAIRVALWRLRKWPSFLMEDVIIRTQFDSVVDEFEKWRNGDLDGSRSMLDIWRQMDRFPNVRIERADLEDSCYHMAISLAITALEEAEKDAAKNKVALYKPPPVHLRHSQNFPLSLTSKRKKDDKKDDDE